MLQSKLMRFAAVGVLSAAALAAVPFAGAASATTPGIKCAKLTGNIFSTASLSRCTGNTGGGSMQLSGSQLGTGGTITWLNGTTTSVTFKLSSGENDPGETRTCPAGTTEYEARGKVTADTTGSAVVGGAAHAEACVAGSGKITLEPGSKLVLK